MYLGGNHPHDEPAQRHTLHPPHEEPRGLHGDQAAILPDIHWQVLTSMSNYLGLHFSYSRSFNQKKIFLQHHGSPMNTCLKNKNYPKKVPKRSKYDKNNISISFILFLVIRSLKNNSMYINIFFRLLRQIRSTFWGVLQAGPHIIKH